MIRAGDLVKLKNIPEVFYTHKVDNINAESIGLVMEWNPAGGISGFGRGGDGFVLWNGRRDWDIEYEEDLEVINAGR